MSQLMSKEILYEPLKELGEKVYLVFSMVKSAYAHTGLLFLPVPLILEGKRWKNKVGRQTTICIPTSHRIQNSCHLRGSELLRKQSRTRRTSCRPHERGASTLLLYISHINARICRCNHLDRHHQRSWVPFLQG